MTQWTDIPLADLAMNEGQLKWLPRNPRQWTQAQLDLLKDSIRETPMLLEARGLIVYPAKKGGYIVIGGNMRLAALRELGEATAPCFILPAETSPEKVKEIVLKDNGEFGSWNFALLAMEWSDIQLEDLGIFVPTMEEYGQKNKELDVGDFSENIVLKLKYDEPQATLVSARLGKDRKQTLLDALDYAG